MKRIFTNDNPTVWACTWFGPKNSHECSAVAHGLHAVDDVDESC